MEIRTVYSEKVFQKEIGHGRLQLFVIGKDSFTFYLHMYNGDNETTWKIPTEHARALYNRLGEALQVTGAEMLRADAEAFAEEYGPATSIPIIPGIGDEGADAPAA